mmetsp:Transcript_113648/g.276018  ORF Transcript_113648/g.276018 Transcript_113648/m.276018 type:complete len:86 (+) Transcript_113648:217-474(+)
MAGGRGLCTSVARRSRDLRASAAPSRERACVFGTGAVIDPLPGAAAEAPFAIERCVRSGADGKGKVLPSPPIQDAAATSGLPMAF